MRDVIHGREVKNREALANPEALEQFRDRRSELTECPERLRRNYELGGTSPKQAACVELRIDAGTLENLG